MRRLLLSIVLPLCLLLAPSSAHAAAPTGLTLTVSPSLVDVGGTALFTLSGKGWVGRTSVELTFLSAHHGFTGPMQWFGSCACFKAAVSLARRVHPLEMGRAVAHIIWPGGTTTAAAPFWIRGLAKNGKSFSPGGATYLSAWVGDPHPAPGIVEHFCAWVHTQDGFGLAGVKVRFVVHYVTGTSNFSTGPTGSNGVACSHHTIDPSPTGTKVTVDVYAGTLHTLATFTPA